MRNIFETMIAPFGYGTLKPHWIIYDNHSSYEIKN